MFDSHSFISRQLESWPVARQRHDALLHSVIERTIDLGIRTVRLQHNPMRAVSTGARVDAASIASRPCFLCRHNRPAEQISAAAGDYEILLNPFPIFPDHLTIPTHNHIPQRIAGRLTDMLGLTRELEGFTIFYNGPGCGASAPDHCHFQAAPSCYFPIRDALPKSCKELEIFDIMPAVMVITHSDLAQASRLAESALNVLPTLRGDDEPMVNILACFDEDVYRIVIIPRRAHRADNFSTDGNGFMISPASIDMAGVIVTPRKADYDRLTASDILNIFKQVGYDAATLNSLI